MSYQVKIRREDRSPQLTAGVHWVARDDAGIWRSYCKGESASNPVEAARQIFHADELGKIGNNMDGTATVEILDGTEA